MQTITRHLRLLCAPTWVIENHLYFQSGVHFVTSTLTGMCHIHCGTHCDIVNIVCVSERCMCTLLKKESLLHANDQSLGTSASLLLLYSDCCPWMDPQRRINQPTPRRSYVFYSGDFVGFSLLICQSAAGSF